MACRRMRASTGGHALREQNPRTNRGRQRNSSTPAPLGGGNGTKKVPSDLGIHAIEKGQAMTLLKWALIMLLISLVAALFGFTDLAAASGDVARVLFYIFLVVFLVLLILGLMG